MNGSIGSDGVSTAARGVAKTAETATTAGSAAASGTASLRAQRENLLEQLRHINEEISASGEIDDPPLYEETVEN